ncbi:MAG: NosD domain-containing protein [Candidatus Heimdallarchaeota archaeon]
MAKFKAYLLVGLLTIALLFVLGPNSFSAQVGEQLHPFIKTNSKIERDSIAKSMEGFSPPALATRAIEQPSFAAKQQFSSSSMGPPSDPVPLAKKGELSLAGTTQSSAELFSNGETLVKWDSSTAHDIYYPYGGGDQAIWETAVTNYGVDLEYTNELFSEAYFDGATAAVIPMFNRGTLITPEEALAVKNFVDAGGRVLLCGYYDKQYWNYFSENGTNLIAEQFGVSYVVPEGTWEENRWAEVLDPVNNYGQPYELRITNFEPHPLTAGVTEWYLKAPSLVVTNPDVTVLARGSPDASYYTESTGWLNGADNVFLALLENENGGGILFSAGAYLLRNDYTAQHGWDHGYDGTQIVENIAPWLVGFQPPLVKWDSSTAHDIYYPYGGGDQAIWETAVTNYGVDLEYTDELFSEAYFDGATAAVIPMFNLGTLITPEEALAVKNFVDAGGRVLLCGYYDKKYWNYFSDIGTNLIAEQFGVSYAVPEGTWEENRWAEVLDPVNNYGQPYELRITNFEPHPLTAGVTEWYLKAPSLVVTNPDVTVLARGSPDASYYTESTGWLNGADNVFLALLENENGGGILFSAGAYLLRNDYTAQHGWDHGYDGTQIVENVAKWLVDYGQDIVWEDEDHVISDDIVIKDGESLTLIRSSLTLAGTEGTPESWPYSSFAPYETQFFYFERQPGQSVRVSISWDNGMESDMMDAGIYSALDYPDYPPFYDVPPDLTNWALATAGGSPETTIFQVPEDKGTLFFVAVFNYAGVDNSGWVEVTDVQCPSIYVESGGTLKVLEGSHMSVSDPGLLGMGILLIQDGGMATFADSSLTDFTTLQIEASDVVIRNVMFAGPGYYDLVRILGASPLIEDSSFWGARSGIYLENSHGAIIRNNVITGCNRIGIEAWFSSQCTIANNDISQMLHGMYLRWIDNFVIESNIINDVELAGIYLRESSYCTLTDNVMENAGGIVIFGVYADHGIHYMAGNTLSGQEILYLRDLEGGEISGPYGQVILANVTGVTVTGLTLTAGGNIQLGNATDCIVHSNTIINTKTMGIILWDTDYCISSANDIAGSSPWLGIWMGYSRNGLISDNTISNFGLYGIWLDSCQDCIISSNSVSDIGNIGIYVLGCSESSVVGNTVMNSNMGIVLDFSDNIIVSESFIHDNWDTGISIGSSYENTISWNQVFGNGWAGIALWDSGGNTITENGIYWNGDTGIHLWNCYANMIFGNEVSESGGAGITLGESGSNTITDNCVYQNGGGINLWSSYENTISANQVFENGWTGIELGQSGGNTITDNHVYQNGWVGIWLGGSGSNTITENCICQNIDVGISLWSSFDNIVSGNEISENGPIGIDLVQSGGNTITDNYISQNVWMGIMLWDSGGNTITDNYISQNGDSGINLGYSHDTTISGNEISGNGWNGISLGDSGSNTITDNDISQNGADGLNLWNSHGNMISDNRIYQNAWLGIRLDNSMWNTIMDNHLYQNNDGGLGLGNSGENVISDNRIYENVWMGIGLGHSWRNTIMDNHIYQNGVDGLNLWSAHGNVISNNQIYQNKANGLYLWISHGNTIADNTIADSGADGICIGDSLDNDITGNTIDNSYYNGIVLYNCGIGRDESIIEGNVVTNSLNSDGIRLEFSTEITVSNNVISNSWIDGIFLYSSENNVVTSNTVTDSGADGIYLHESANNVISNNFMANNGVSGVHLYFSTANSLSTNIITNSWSGILLQNSNDNPVTGNIVDYSTRVGVYVYYSEGNVVTENAVSHSSDHGLYLRGAHINDITWNSFFQNNFGGISQGYDDGWGNTIENNYWDDWTSPDDEEPYGIVDYPYVIDGIAGNEDPWPRTTP